MPLGRSMQMEQSGGNEALNSGLPRIVTTFYVMEIYMHEGPPFLVRSKSESSGFLGLAWDGASPVPGGEFCGRPPAASVRRLADRRLPAHFRPNITPVSLGSVFRL